MIETYKISFRLHFTCLVNNIIYMLKCTPLIRRLLPSSLYANKALKSVVTVLAGIWTFLSAFSGKLIYLGILFAMTFMNSDLPSADIFITRLIIGTVIGMFLNSRLVEPKEDKYYAVFMMRMDPRKYALSDFYGSLLQTFIGFLPFSLLFGGLAKVNLWVTLFIPFFVVAAKGIYNALALRFGHKADLNTRKARDVASSVLRGFSLVALTIAAFWLPKMKLLISARIFPLIAIGTVLISIPCFLYLNKFPRYRDLYKVILRPGKVMKSQSSKNAIQTQKKTIEKEISTDTSISSNKHGYALFNDLFTKRHRSLLMKSPTIVTLISTAVILIFFVALIFAQGLRKDVNEMILQNFPVILLVMYFINRGTTITKAFFMNCDHSMLTYRFYRQSDVILSIFRNRLKTVVIINLLPASPFAIGIPLLLWISGGTSNPLNYLYIFVSVFVMSIFFSIHHMVLYYLLQPYTENLEMKNPVFTIVNLITYYVCCGFYQVKIPTNYFCPVMLSFCVIYIIVAYFLAYKLAPKTFHLRHS